MKQRIEFNNSCLQQVHNGTAVLDATVMASYTQFKHAHSQSVHNLHFHEKVYDVPKATPLTSRPAVPAKPRSLQLNADQPLAAYPWFFGKITRIQAEGAVKTMGDFLVRASISEPGEFVLTGHDGARAMHFRINRTAGMFHFEEEQFDSIPDLVDFYRSHAKPVTVQSHCCIVNGVDRHSRQLDSLMEQLQDELQANYAHITHSSRSQHQQPHSEHTPRCHSGSLLRPSAPRRPLPKLPTLPNNVSPLERKVLLSQASKQLTRKFGSESHLMNRTAFSPAMPHKSPVFSDFDRSSLQKQQSCVVLTDDGFDSGSQDYCDVDYDEMEAPTTEATSSSSGCSISPPALPRRNKTPERDSACVPDLPIYDHLANEDYSTSRVAIRRPANNRPFHIPANLRAKAGDGDALAWAIHRHDLQLLGAQAPSCSPLPLFLAAGRGAASRKSLLDRCDQLGSFVRQSVEADRSLSCVWLRCAEVLLQQAHNHMSFVTVMQAVQGAAQPPQSNEHSVALQRSLGLITSHQHDLLRVNVPYLQPLLLLLSQPCNPLATVFSGADWATQLQTLNGLLHSCGQWLSQRRPVSALDRSAFVDPFMGTDYVANALAL